MLHWYACGADGLSVGRSVGVRGHAITKFSRMGSLPHFLTYGAPLITILKNEVFYEIVDFFLLDIKSSSERQNLLEVAGTAKSSSKRQKLLKSLIPSPIGKGLVTNNKSRHAPLACSKQKWRTTR